MIEKALENSVAVVSRYNVPGHAQANLAEFFQGQLQAWISRRPGFVAGSVLSSIDEQSVVVCTNWRLPEHGINFMNCEQAKGFWSGLTESGAQARESRAYRVGTVVTLGD